MRVLYIFPHPDDESFGPAAAISQQTRSGHEVFLLTLTRGGATKERFKYDYSVEQMGRIRHAEMQDVAKVLDLSDLTVLDFPDSGLKELDPRILEQAVREHIQNTQPAVLVTYPVHGISGFHDHLVTHHIVKRVFLEFQDAGFLKRLAFYTITQAQAEKAQYHKLNFSSEDDIDCILHLAAEDTAALTKALQCYKTYRAMIAKTGVKDLVSDKAHFDIFQEGHNPPISDLFFGLV
jgi:LmbE family N-acetylglucosaminyl deacetylase